MKSTVFRLIKYIGKSRAVLRGLIGCTLVVTGVDIAAPMLQQKAIDTISYENRALMVDFDKMKQYLLILLIIFLLSAMLAFLGEMNGQVEEKVTCYQTVVAFSKEKETVECFAEVSEKLRVNSIRARVWGSILGPITNFLGNFQYVLLAGVGGYLKISGKSAITIGSIQAMLLYSKKLNHPINMIANQYANILTALAGAERIFEVLDSLDEISVDTRTEVQIQQAMANLMKGRTSLIIAHRISTIRDAGVIVVVRDGVIAEYGNHEELLCLEGNYYDLYSNQFMGIHT